MKFVLKPFGNGAQHLKTLELSEEVPSRIVGRNAATGLDKPCDHIQHVSRTHVIMNYRSGNLYMDVVSRQDDLVYLNNAVCQRGEIQLHPGDQISLLGAIQCFNYRVEFIETNTQEFPPAKKLRTEEPIAPVQQTSNLVTTSSSSSSSSVPVEEAKEEKASSFDHKSLVSDLLRQYECEICYEVMACAFTLVPCGDCFCYGCIEDWYQSAKNSPSCPHCQGKFDLQQAIPNKNNDNAVRAILKLEPEQLKAWEARVEDGLQRRKKFQEGPKPTTPIQQRTGNQPPPLPARGNTLLSHFRFANPVPPAPAPAPAPQLMHQQNRYINPFPVPPTPVVPPAVVQLVSSPPQQASTRRSQRSTPNRRYHNNPDIIVDLNLGNAHNSTSSNAAVVDLTKNDNNNSTNNSGHGMTVRL